MGEEMRDAVRLALEDCPNKRVEYQLFFEDNESNKLSSTNLAIRRLVNLNKVDFVFSMWPSNASVIAPYVEKSHIVHFNLTWYSNAFARYHWTCIEGPGMEDFTDKLVYILKKRGCKRVAFASFVEEGIRELSSVVIPRLKKEGFEVVFNELAMPDERDFRMYVLKLRETHPDGLIQFFDPPQELIFNRRMHELDCNIATVTGSFDFYSSEATKYMEGQIYPAFIWVEEGFQTKFKERFGYETTSYAGYMYDLTKMVVRVIENYYATNGRPPTHEELLGILKTPRTVDDLVIGKAIVHDNGWMEVPFVIRKIQNGKPIEWKE